MLTFIPWSAPSLSTQYHIYQSSLLWHQWWGVLSPWLVFGDGICLHCCRLNLDSAAAVRHPGTSARSVPAWYPQDARWSSQPCAYRERMEHDRTHSHTVRCDHTNLGARFESEVWANLRKRSQVRSLFQHKDWLKLLSCKKNSHYIDKRVMRLSYLHNGNSYTGKNMMPS